MCSFPAVVDRTISSFLDTVSFVRVRSICRVHWSDQEAWALYAKHIGLSPSLGATKRTIALHSLVTRAKRFGERAGTLEWYQCVVNWLRYRTSIQLIHSFFFRSNTLLFSKMQLWCIPSGQRLLWQRLWDRYHRRAYQKSVYSPNKHGCNGDCGFGRQLLQSCIVTA